MPKFVGGGRPFPPKICVQSDPPTAFQTTQFRPISAHSASIVTASEKVQLALIGSRPRAFQRAIAVCASKIHVLYKKKSATKFLCVKTSSGKVVATSFPYPTVHTSIAGDVPIYLKLAFKVTHPFRKRRFPKLLFNRA